MVEKLKNNRSSSNT